MTTATTAAASHAVLPTDARPDVIWYTRCPVPTASSIAIERGWLDAEFARDGIRVASLRESPSRRVRESHFDHTLPNAFRQGGNIPAIWARSEGRDVVLIGLTWVDRSQAILVAADSDIRTLRDLRGRRLAVPRRLHEKIDFWRATTLRGFASALALAGIAESEVELVDLPVDEPYIGELEPSHTGSLFTARSQQRLHAREIMALARGEVDAIFATGPWGLDASALLGARVLVDFGYHPDPRVRTNIDTPSTLTVSGALLREHPDLVARYLARLLRVARWAEDHADETRRILANDAGTAEAWIVEGYAKDIHARLGIDLAADSVAAIESQKRFLLERGFIERDFDVDDWIDPTVLERAREIARFSLV